MIHLSQSRPATVFSIVSMEIGASYKSGFEIALRRRRRRRRPRDPDSIGVSFGGVGLLYSRRVTGIKWGMIKITRLRVRVSSRDPLLGEGARGERVAFANRGGDGNWRWGGGGREGADIVLKQCGARRPCRCATSCHRRARRHQLTPLHRLSQPSTPLWSRAGEDG